jgi:hypothetical protein
VFSQAISEVQFVLPRQSLFAVQWTMDVTGVVPQQSNAQSGQLVAPSGTLLQGLQPPQTVPILVQPTSFTRSGTNTLNGYVLYSNEPLLGALVVQQTAFAAVQSTSVLFQFVVQNSILTVDASPSIGLLSFLTQLFSLQGSLTAALGAFIVLYGKAGMLLRYVRQHRRSHHVPSPDIALDQRLLSSHAGVVIPKTADPLSYHAVCAAAERVASLEQTVSELQVVIGQLQRARMGAPA